MTANTVARPLNWIIEPVENPKSSESHLKLFVVRNSGPPAQRIAACAVVPDKEAESVLLLATLVT
jgi:hypothetical protein